MGLASAPATAQPSGGASPSDLVALLQAGGLIMYVRHGATDHAQSDRDVTDLTRCDLQRNLSEQGKSESRVMAAALDRFELPIGAVYTSPYCRNIDTAAIVFGRYEVREDLKATFFTNVAETRRLNRALRTLLAQFPKPGANTAIIGHTANLSDVTQVWPKPEGVVHVFRPLGEDGFEHLGRIEPSDWARLMQTQ